MNLHLLNQASREIKSVAAKQCLCSYNQHSVSGKMLGAALESFSAGRLGIMQESVGTLSHAAVIAIRYAALRKQFGPDRNGPELPIIEYQLHVSDQDILELIGSIIQ